MEHNHQLNYGGMQFPAAAAASSNNYNGLIIQDYEFEVSMTVEDYLNSFPPGFRFCPEDIELAEGYLKKKAFNEPLPPNKICEVNIYSTHPAEFAEKFQPITEGEWYFFTPREKKYPNGKRPSRSTGDVGYWKPTGTDKPIRNYSGKTVGFKKTLDYYEGKHPNGTKTDWKMHEYKLTEDDENPSRTTKDKDDMMLDECVLVRIYRKKEKNKDNNDEGSGGVNAENRPSVNEEGAPSMLGNHNQAALQNANHHEAALQNGNHHDSALQNGNHNQVALQPNPNQGLLRDLSNNLPFSNSEIDGEIDSYFTDSWNDAQSHQSPKGT